MSLAKKFVIILVSSVIIIAITNIIAFYAFYSSYLKVYLSEKLESKSKAKEKSELETESKSFKRIITSK